MRVKRAAVLIASTIIAALVLSCANQAQPSGGPEDKTPPELTAMSPKPGAVNVDLNTDVAFYFSEWISASASAVAVHPKLPRRPDVRVSRNRLEIRPKDPLEPNTTYLVVVNTSLKDLRGNALPESITLMFSTGDSVDESILEVLKPETKEEEEEVEEISADKAYNETAGEVTEKIDGEDEADVDADVDTDNTDADADKTDIDTDADTDDTDVGAEGNGDEQ